MIKNYDSFKFEQTLENYVFNDSMSDIEFEKYIDRAIFEINEGKFSEWKESMTQKLAMGLLKIWDMVEKVSKVGVKVIKKIFDACLVVIKALGKWCDKYKKVCMLIIVIIIMITVGAASSYAAANPTDPNLPELANAALGFIDKFSDQMVDGGAHESTIHIAKSILTQLRNGGEAVDYSQVSKEAQAIANTAMKMANDIKSDDPDQYSQFVDMGSKITTQFTYVINGLKTIIGG